MEEAPVIVKIITGLRGMDTPDLCPAQRELFSHAMAQKIGFGPDITYPFKVAVFHGSNRTVFTRNIETEDQSKGYRHFILQCVCEQCMRSPETWTVAGYNAKEETVSLETKRPSEFWRAVEVFTQFLLVIAFMTMAWFPSAASVLGAVSAVGYIASGRDAVSRSFSSVHLKEE